MHRFEPLLGHGHLTKDGSGLTTTSDNGVSVVASLSARPSSGRSSSIQTREAPCTKPFHMAKRTTLTSRSRGSR